MTENNTMPTDESPEAIRRDIEQTRAQLVETAQQLSDKADVKAQAHQKLEQSGAKIKETISQAKAAADEKLLRRTVTAMHSSERSGLQTTACKSARRWSNGRGSLRASDVSPHHKSHAGPVAPGRPSPIRTWDSARGCCLSQLFGGALKTRSCYCCSSASMPQSSW